MIAVGPLRDVRIDLQRARRRSAARIHSLRRGPAGGCRCGRDSDPIRQPTNVRRTEARHSMSPH